MTSSVLHARAASLCALALLACGLSEAPARPSSSTGGERGPGDVSRRGEDDDDAGALAVEDDARAPALPRDQGALWPALTRTRAAEEPGRRTLGAVLSDIDSCARCHPDVAAQWRSSAHSLASFNNPIYRASIDRFRERVSAEASRMCAGCHDPALLVDGAMDEARVRPTDPRAHAGVSCRTCHGIQEATYDGNGSYTLRAATEHDAPDPDDPQSVAAHARAQAGPALGSPAMCGSCHRAFLGPETGLPHHLAGADDLGPWLASAHAGSDGARLDDEITRRDCRGCHMPREPAPLGDLAAAADGTIVSHRFTGGHTWLAAMAGDGEQLARQRERLVGVASIDIAGARVGAGAWALPAESMSFKPGDTVTVDVVLRNLDVGHNFPGGTRDAQDTWIELRVVDREGRELVAEAPESRHVLRAYVAGEDGRPRDAREVEDLRAVVVDHTIAPRDAALVRYAFTLPPALARDAWPLTVDARLLHRSRGPALARETCTGARSGVGRRFVGETAKLGGVTLDACAAPPVTVIATAAIEFASVGAPGAATHELFLPSGATYPNWERLYVRGLALLHQRQEHLDEAGESFTAALASAPRELPARARAQLLAGQAQLAAARNRVDETRSFAEAAAGLVGGDHQLAPALVRARARSLEQTWRTAEAAALLATLTRVSPRDPTLWRALARTRGASGDASGALAAATAGLALAPRDEGLLRTQALALQDLGAPEADAARAAYLRHRVPDRAPRYRRLCEQRSELCARERVPVHVHMLRPLAKEPARGGESP